MTLAPIQFACAQETKITPCYSLVYAWLKANGVEVVPSDTQSRKWWMEHGPEIGMVKAAEFMGLEPSKGSFGDVAVFEQTGGAPVLGVIAANGFGVVRSFGRMAVWQPVVLRSWGLPWAK
jgi:hypothetical protein